jgi:hypothetical protein
VLSSKRHWACVAIGASVAACAGGLWAQNGNGANKSAFTYLAISAMPSAARDHLAALGDRLRRPGKERLTVSGQYDDPVHAGGAASYVWEIPGRVHLERAGHAPVTVDPSSPSYQAQLKQLSAGDAGIIESLLDDGPEGFLYGIVQGHARRFLGSRFRLDDGANPSYAGPWFDIYENVGHARSLSGTPLVQKHFFFDSVTKLLVRTTYSDSHTGAPVLVLTEFSGWTSQAGQAVPGRIVRKENGVAAFALNVTAATVGPPANDGVFNGQ